MKTQHWLVETIEVIYLCPTINKNWTTSCKWHNHQILISLVFKTGLDEVEAPTQALGLLPPISMPMPTVTGDGWIEVTLI